MKKRIFPTLLIAALICAQLACNYGSVSVLATPTTAPTATVPSVTPLPPTATATLPPPPTATTAPTATIPVMVNTPVPPTLEPTRVPTRAAVKPMPKGRFSAEFPGGTFTFRINDAGTYVTLKEITLSKAKCGNGKTVSTHLTFEDISFFEIKDGAFTISFDRTTVSGTFDTPSTAHGTIWIKINANKGVCEIAATGWTAVAAAAQ